MTTYVNTSASEIFSRFKEPKTHHFFHFTSLFTINFCEVVYSVPPLTTINFSGVVLVPLAIDD